MFRDLLTHWGDQLYRAGHFFMVGAFCSVAVVVSSQSYRTPRGLLILLAFFGSSSALFVVAREFEVGAGWGYVAGVANLWIGPALMRWLGGADFEDIVRVVTPLLPWTKGAEGD